MVDQILSTLRSELSDVTDVEQATRVLFRLLLAALLGGLLGYDRELKGKAAGLRTYMLVCIGSAFFVMVPKLSGMSDDGLSRVVQGLVAGIGFLGAGSIIQNKSEEQTVGLTTAAGLWFTAAIGVAAGTGRDATAIAGALIALFVLALIPRFQSRAPTVDAK